MNPPPEIPDELRMDEESYPEYKAPSESEQRANRTRQAKAWSIALDPVYGLIGMGVVGFMIDAAAGTGKTWTITLSILGLVGGFYLFIKEAMKLNSEQTRSSDRTDGDPGT
ncbi:MAG: AtpZ/AtpI family protein [Phycisphaerales bacterium]|mgnify:FL=1|tara:strand:- start:492 stop:824 length:333 start_codon:yes stop_codon:yes gene_type:complete